METYAIVGNGPKESFSSQSAARIDACDHVIRINNYRVDGWEGLVGRRTTIWATTFMYDVQPNFSREYDENLVTWITLPLFDVTWIRSESQHYDQIQYNRAARLLAARPMTEMIDYSEWRRAGRVSAGLTVLVWLYLMRKGSLRGLVIEGFSFFNKHFAHHYFERGLSRSVHDYGTESALFYRLAERTLEMGDQA